MDRMLHRGRYSSGKQQLSEECDSRHSAQFWWQKLIGIDDDFSRTDRWISGSLFGCTALLFFVSVMGTLWNLISPWPISAWSAFWRIVGSGIPIFLAAVTGVWFAWGGLKDMRSLFRRLKAESINVLDDGTVVNRRNLDEVSDAQHRIESTSNQ